MISSFSLFCLSVISRCRLLSSKFKQSSVIFLYSYCIFSRLLSISPLNFFFSCYQRLWSSCLWLSSNLPLVLRRLVIWVDLELKVSLFPMVYLLRKSLRMLEFLSDSIVFSLAFFKVYRFLLATGEFSMKKVWLKVLECLS